MFSFYQNFKWYDYKPKNDWNYHKNCLTLQENDNQALALGYFFRRLRRTSASASAGMVSKARMSTPAPNSASTRGVCHVIIVAALVVSTYSPRYSEPSCRPAPNGPTEPAISTFLLPAIKWATEQWSCLFIYWHIQVVIKKRSSTFILSVSIAWVELGVEFWGGRPSGSLRGMKYPPVKCVEWGRGVYPLYLYFIIQYLPPPSMIYRNRLVQRMLKQSNAVKTLVSVSKLQRTECYLKQAPFWMCCSQSFYVNKQLFFRIGNI